MPGSKAPGSTFLFFIYQGENDVLLTPRLARAYFNDVVAPIKRMC